MRVKADNQGRDINYKTYGLRHDMAFKLIECATCAYPMSLGNFVYHGCPQCANKKYYIYEGVTEDADKIRENCNKNK